MDSYQFMFISAYTILIPCLIGVIRFKHICPTFYPFVYFIFLSTVNEFLATATLYVDHRTSLNYNIYYLLEAFILTYQFKKWGSIKNKSVYYYGTILFLFSIWLAESFITKTYKYLNSYYLVSYAFYMVLMSIRTICRFDKNDSSSSLLGPKFLICCTFILLYSNMILVDTFSAWSLNVSISFKWKLLDVLNVVNIICNLSFALCILQISKKWGNYKLKGVMQEELISTFSDKYKVVK